ncbi:MAG: hypothetical protein ACD_46C00456G0008, partial [uncultured bacterium]
MNDKIDVKEAQWKIDLEQQAPFDPLLSCLMILAQIHNRPTSARALSAGLPLVNHKLTPKLFIEAAKRADFSANLSKITLEKISSDLLPATLLLSNQRACVLISIDTINGIARIIQPESGAGIVEIEIKKLDEQYGGYALFLQPAYHFDSRSEQPLKTKEGHWFWSVITKTWPDYAEVIIASLLINTFALASPLFIMNVYNRVIPNAAVNTLWVLASGILIIFIFDFILRNLRSYFIESTGKSIDVQLSDTTFHHLLDIEMANRPNSVGSLANSIQSFESLRDFLTTSTVSVLVDLPFVLLFLLVIGIIGGYLVLIPIIAIPIIFFISFSFQSTLMNLINQTYRHNTEKNAILFETLSGIENIKGMRAEGLMQRKWENVVKSATQINLKLHQLINTGTTLSLFVQQLAVIMIIIVGVYSILLGNLTVGGLIACSILGSRTLAPISQVGGLIMRYQQSKSALVGLDKIMQLPVERPAGNTFIHPKKIEGRIEFRNVTFNYPEQKISTLNNISFLIEPGDRVGIIGRTGSGKSTIAKLILKFYQPDSGSILLDNLDERQLDPVDIRHFIGYTPQDITLFHGSVRENIVIGAPYIDDYSLLQAVK